jgi:addiction module RelE/StbE family toxin
MPAAEEEFDEIFEYVARDNPEETKRLLEKFDSAICQLSAFPELGVVPKDARLKYLGYRTLIVENYLVFYMQKEEIVEIHRVIHGSRRYSFLF